MTQFAMILERYDDPVIEYVTSPITGLQRRLKFAPVPAEIVEACEAEAAHRARIAKHSSIPTPAVRLAKPSGHVQDFEALVRKHGRPIGVFEQGRQLPYAP